MKKFLAHISASAGLVLLPGLALAQGLSTAVSNTKSLVDQFQGIVSSALVVLMGIAVIFFIVGIIRFVLAAGDAEKRKEAKGYMFYGVIAFVVIVGLYGLVNVILGFFGAQAGGVIPAPKIQ